MTQTGVGFVYKRKLRTLRNLFSKSRAQTTALPQEGAVRTAGDILRKLMSKPQEQTPANEEKIDRQPVIVKEDEKKQN